MPQGGTYGGAVPYHPGSHDSLRSLLSPSSSEPKSSPSYSLSDNSNESPTWVPGRSKSSTANRHQHVTKAPKKHNIKTPVVTSKQAGFIGKKSQLWPDEKEFLKVRFLNGPREYKELVEKLVTEHYNTLPMRIRFVFLGSADASASDIRIRFGSHGSYSSVGLDCASVPQSEPTMNLDLDYTDRDYVQHTILHEFGHALGLWHEHQHPRCGFRWQRFMIDVSQPHFDLNFERIQLGPKAAKERLTPYDEKSIMHYPIEVGETIDMNKYVPVNKVLSSGDKRVLSRMYSPTADIEKKTELCVPEDTMVSKPITTVTKPPTTVSRQLDDLVCGLTISPPPITMQCPSQPPVHVTGFANTEATGGNVMVSSCGNTVINGDSYVNITGPGMVILNGNGRVWMSGSGTLVVNGNCIVMTSGKGRVPVKGSGQAQVSGSACVKFSGQGLGKTSENGSLQQYCSL
ncbi:uncharacterized protein PG986_013840 [Apiospora aurea]|uniref:Metalloendopeptidase n=1 Tax=Apiospora aurea TaxID=335848 RepID=A0ABR1PX18_9PEZI